MTDIKTIQESVIPIAKRYGATKLALFGSYARGNVHSKSDVDLLVECDDSLSILDFVQFKIDIQNKLNMQVDLVEYNTLKPQLRDRVLKEQILLYGS